jgi:hypothetical protein
MKNLHQLKLAAAVAAVLTLPSVSGPARAEERATVPGFQVQATPSQSSEVTNIPTPEEVRRAMMTPISKQPSVGGQPGVTTAGSAPGSGASKAGEPPPSGPIGSFGETIPAKFSQRNDILDRIPTMALPLPLTDQQRKEIFDAVMADNSQPVAGADALKPTSQLSTDQALNGLRPLPESLRGIEGLAKLQYVRAKNKVLLVEPSTRTVVEEITS